MAEQVLLRAEARAAKDFTRADAVRLRLAERGVLLKDAAGGSSWKPGVPAAAAATAAVGQ